MMRLQTVWLCLCLLWLHIATDPQLHDKNDYGHIFYELGIYVNIEYNLHDKIDYGPIFYKLGNYLSICYDNLWTLAIGSTFLGLWTLVLVLRRSSPPVIPGDCDERLTTWRTQMDIKENAELKYLRTRRCLMEEKKIRLERDLLILDTKIKNLEFQSSNNISIQDQHLQNIQASDILTQSVSNENEGMERMKNFYLKKTTLPNTNDKNPVCNIFMERESQKLYQELWSLKHRIQRIKKYQQGHKGAQSSLQKESSG